MHQADAAQPQQTQSARTCVFCLHADRQRQHVTGEAEKMKVENTDDVQIYSISTKVLLRTYNSLKRLVFQVKNVGCFFSSCSKADWEQQIPLANVYPSSFVLHSPDSKVKVAEATGRHGKPSDKVFEIANAPGKLTDSDTHGL